jgi:hypothetical protein
MGSVRFPSVEVAATQQLYATKLRSLTARERAVEIAKISRRFFRVMTAARLAFRNGKCGEIIHGNAFPA